MKGIGGNEGQRFGLNGFGRFGAFKPVAGNRSWNTPHHEMARPDFFREIQDAAKQLKVVVSNERLSMVFDELPGITDVRAGGSVVCAKTVQGVVELIQGLELNLSDFLPADSEKVMDLSALQIRCETYKRWVDQFSSPDLLTIASRSVSFQPDYAALALSDPEIQHQIARPLGGYFSPLFKSSGPVEMLASRSREFRQMARLLLEFRQSDILTTTFAPHFLHQSKLLISLFVDSVPGTTRFQFCPINGVNIQSDLPTVFDSVSRFAESGDRGAQLVLDGAMVQNFEQLKPEIVQAGELDALIRRVISTRSVPLISSMMSQLDSSEYLPVFISLSNTDPVIAKNWIDDSHALAVSLSCAGTEVWTPLNSKMESVLADYKSQDPYTKNRDITAAFFCQFARSTGAFDQIVANFSDSAVTTLLKYFKHRRRPEQFLEMVCPSIGPERGGRLWTLATRSGLIDPTDSKFIGESTVISLNKQRLSILEFVNPALYSVYRGVEVMFIAGQCVSSEEKVRDISLLTQSIRAVAHWDDQVLLINVPGHGRALDFLQQELAGSDLKSLAENRALTELFLVLAPRMSPDQLRFSVKKGVQLFSQETATFLLERCLMANIGVDQILNSDLMLPKIGHSALCGQPVPQAFNAIARLDVDALKLLLTANPQAIHHVSEEKMNIAQFSVLALNWRLYASPQDSVQLLAQFQEVLTTCLNFGFAIGTDLRNSPEGGQYTLDQLITYLPALVTKADKTEIQEAIDTVFVDQDVAKAIFMSQFLELSGSVRALDSGVDGVWTATVASDIAACEIRRVQPGESLDSSLLWSREHRLDIPLNGQFQHYQLIERVFSLADGLMGNNPESIRLTNELLDRYSSALPTPPAFSDRYVVQSLMLNADLAAHLDSSEMSEFRQLGVRLNVLASIAAKLGLFGNSQSETSLGAKICKISERRDLVNASGLESIPGVEVSSANDIDRQLDVCRRVDIHLFRSVASRVLGQIDLEGILGAVILPRRFVDGDTLSAVKLGNVIGYQRKYGASCTPIAGQISMIANVDQIILFPQDVTQSVIDRSLHLLEASSGNVSSQIGVSLGIPMTVVDVSSKISEIGLDMLSRPVNVSESGRFSIDGRFEFDILSAGDVADVPAYLVSTHGPVILSNVAAFKRGDLPVSMGQALKLLREKTEIDLELVHDANTLLSAVAESLLKYHGSRLDSVLSTLSILSGNSYASLNIDYFQPFLKSMDPVSSSTVVVARRSGHLYAVRVLDFADSFTETSDTQSQRGEDSLMLEADDLVFDGASLSMLHSIVSGNSTCWLETLVNADAIQTSNAMGRPVNEYPPMVRMILSALPRLDYSKLISGDVPKMNWVFSFLNFIGQLVPDSTDVSTIPRSIRSLAEDWETHFEGGGVGHYRESDHVMGSISNFLLRLVADPDSDSTDRHASIFSHPFSSLEDIRRRPGLESTVFPAGSLESMLIRVRPQADSRALNDGILHLHRLPDSMYTDVEPTVAAEALGSPPDSRIVREFEAELMVSQSVDCTPGTLVMRFNSSSNGLKKEAFNPHMIDGNMLVATGGGLYSVSSILGQPGGHWVTVFSGSVLPEPGKSTVFYEKLLNGINAEPVSFRSWDTALSRYFQKYPSVLVRASRVPLNHYLFGQAISRGILELSHEEQSLRAAIDAPQPNATLDGPSTLGPQNLAEFRELVDFYSREFVRYISK